MVNQVRLGQHTRLKCLRYMALTTYVQIAQDFAKICVTALSFNLYHFTYLGHVRSILADGFLKTTNSNIKPDGGGPPVVWLTSDSSHGQAWGPGCRPGKLPEDENSRRRGIRAPGASAAGGAGCANVR